MKKELIIFGGLLVVIVFLVVMIVMVADPAFFFKLGLEPWGTPTLIRNWISQLGKEKPSIAPCPSELQIYYSIDRNGTTDLRDDTIYIQVKNQDAHNYSGRLFVDGELQDVVSLNGMATAVSESELINEWWRSGNQSDSRYFGIDLRIEGCNKTISELAPTLDRPIIAGGGGGGDGGDGSGGGGGRTGQNRSQAPPNNSSGIGFVKVAGVLPD
jgi:hypothetical protein